jgi:hypothetical protein
VEVVPTPKENIVLLPYFRKTGVLNGFRPCNLAACFFPQKNHGQKDVREIRARPVPDMAENKTGFPDREKDDFFQGKKRGSAMVAAGEPSRGYSLTEMRPFSRVSPPDMGREDSGSRGHSPPHFFTRPP